MNGLVGQRLYLIDHGRSMMVDRGVCTMIFLAFTFQRAVKMPHIFDAFPEESLYVPRLLLRSGHVLVYMLETRASRK